MKYLPKVAEFLNVVAKGGRSQTQELIVQIKLCGLVEQCLSSGRIKQSNADKKSSWAEDETEFIFSFSQKVILRDTNQLVVRSLNFQTIDEDVLLYIRQIQGKTLDTAYSRTLPDLLFQIGNGPWGTSARQVNPTNGSRIHGIFSTLAKRLTTAFREQPSRFTSTNRLNLDHPARLAESHEDEDGVVYTVKYSRAFTLDDMRGYVNEELVLADVKPRAT